jgi:acyl dehydratase
VSATRELRGLYWNDVAVGDRWVTGRRTITDATVELGVGLGGLTEPIFIDDLHAQSSHFGRRLVPGPLTVLIMLGLWQQTAVFAETTMGMLGFEQIRFPAPVHIGDTLQVTTEVLETRPTRRPERGLIRWRWTCANQDGREVVVLETSNLVRCRGGRDSE